MFQPTRITLRTAKAPSTFLRYRRCFVFTSSMAALTSSIAVYIYLSYYIRTDLSKGFEFPEEITSHVNFDELSEVYHSPEVFRLDYAEMERNFKVYIYPDGDDATYYHTPRKLKGKYASEDFFFQNIRECRFRIEDPERAHLFFLPISCHKIRGKDKSYEQITAIVQNYIQSLISKYPYWNKTLGTDHFFLTCHDIGVEATSGLPFLVKNSIRVVCISMYDLQFIPHKDVSLPQIQQPFRFPAGGNDAENRTTLCFWIARHDLDIRGAKGCETGFGTKNNSIFMAKGKLEYHKMFYRSKFCICLHGSPFSNTHIAASIHYGCVPVILSDYYELPFNDVLDWRKFSLILDKSKIYQLEDILKNVTDMAFIALHKNLVQIQKHFQWNDPPVRHDAFHMVMYDLWLRRHVTKN